ncbi:oligopeptide:H+ symporter [Saccharopolyspora indica]|uniref:peptide MFS transporter n=1 Tax=Saccharopolyspora indica TaxID=1229659 RepID=UPI0022EAC615|nr:oligopeptide:H+ symporter [Saccharopolyspora indica]MDA3647652.1 oligopeptide:H+ symporter [Saccharopolyspora indica]
MTSTTAASSRERGHGRFLFGQPRWFTTIFVVDMWERFSFYGMLAILYLYLVASPADGGFGMDPTTAAAVFGIYMSMVFVTALPGGWIADRVWGPRRSLLFGGVLIALGHISLATPVQGSLFLGLVLIAIGTGLVKPSIAAIVSSAHPGQNEKREAAFSVFYMSTQISALLAPIVTGYLGENVNWHLGFGVAAAGMIVALVHYGLGYKQFEAIAAAPRPASRAELRVVARRTGIVIGAVAAVFAVDVLSGAFTPRHVLMAIGLTTIVVPVLYFRYLKRQPSLTTGDRRRVSAFLWLLLASALFWMLYAQSGSVLSGFAKDSTDRQVAAFEVPASWFQSAHPLYILLLAPVFAWLWVRMGRRVGVPAKFSGALLFGGAAFVLIAVAAVQAADGLVSPLWLLAAYLLQVCGELALAPVGLSMAAQVAPRGFTNQMLGLFWLFAALGVGVGGQLAGLLAVLPQPLYFGSLGLVAVVAGVLLGFSAKRLFRRLL